MSETKKVVLVLMEGTNDERTTFPHIESLIDNSGLPLKAKQKAVFYDITNQTDGGKFIDSTNIKFLLNKKISEALKEYRLNRSDLSEIILIIDIDGVYIDDSLVIEDKTLNHVIYSNNNITCKNKNALLDRNCRKRNNISFLLNYTKYLTNTPFRVFYYSCNSEHVLYNEINCTRERKEELAISAIKESDNIFWEKIRCNNVSNGTSYIESWDYLMNISEEIPRATNLYILYCDYTRGDEK